MKRIIMDTKLPIEPMCSSSIEWMLGLVLLALFIDSSEKEKKKHKRKHTRTQREHKTKKKKKFGEKFETTIKLNFTHVTNFE